MSSATAAGVQAPDHRMIAGIEPLLESCPLPELTGKRLFITGGTGFVGRWLLCTLAALNARGAGIRATLLSRRPQDFLARCPAWQGTPWLQVIGGDVTNYAFPDAGFDAFIHGAADTSPAACRSPALVDDLVVGTRRVMAHAAAVGARRLLCIGSGAIYGEQPANRRALAEDDAMPALATDDYYGQGKRAMEAIVREDAGRPSNAGNGPLPATVVARCFSFVGFGLPPHLAISRFIDDALNDRDILIAGDGQPVRSYLHAADMALWLLAMLARGEAGRTYNVGSPEALRLSNVATVVRDTLAPKREIIILGQETGAPRQRYVPDTRRIETELGVACWTPLAEALRQTAEAMRMCRQP